LVNTNGEPIVIDPVVYYGDAEADVSLTYIFRGFTVSFYQAVSQKNGQKVKALLGDKTSINLITY
jgi:fructosamine-3-kinase